MPKVENRKRKKEKRPLLPLLLLPPLIKPLLATDAAAADGGGGGRRRDYISFGARGARVARSLQLAFPFTLTEHNAQFSLEFLPSQQSGYGEIPL